MVKLETTIINNLGLHARAAAKFVSLASSFESDIKVSKNDQTINGKSIMGVIMLAAAKDSLLVLTIEGKDEEVAAQKLSELIADRFGEEE
ncbi:MAG: HPr family phosphocarrier protein [Gammaproteobacteria bacterium]|nr:HPr family phosphocarrier protein [Gammaproteobacteria bacterium]